MENYCYQSKPKVAEALIIDLLAIQADSTKDTLTLKPGQMVWLAVLKTEKHGSGKTLAKTKSKHVILSVVADPDISDYSRGVKPSRILVKRIARIVNEAYHQSGVLSQADIALIFNLSQAKVSQLILGYQKEKKVMLPPRGVFLDIGRSITHKLKIIRMYTQNYSTKDIARTTSHAPSSVDRYIRDFQRVKIPWERGMILSEIAYITSLSENLVSEYVKIVKEHVLKN